MTRNCTQTGVQSDITLNDTTGEEYLGTKKRTPVVNHKPAAPKEKFSQDILAYLNSKDYLKPVLGYLPQKILKRRKRNIDGLYTVDRDIASKCRPAYFGRVTAPRALFSSVAVGYFAKFLHWYPSSQTRPLCKHYPSSGIPLYIIVQLHKT
jgi:hypothetical protein